jgi:hypothetical protein
LIDHKQLKDLYDDVDEDEDDELSQQDDDYDSEVRVGAKRPLGGMRKKRGGVDNEDLAESKFLKHGSSYDRALEKTLKASGVSKDGRIMD